KRYREVVDRHVPETPPIQRIERFAFYERAKQAFAVVMTGETAKYGNIILKKGDTPVGGCPWLRAGDRPSSIPCFVLWAKIVPVFGECVVPRCTGHLSQETEDVSRWEHFVICGTM